MKDRGTELPYCTDRKSLFSFSSAGCLYFDLEADDSVFPQSRHPANLNPEEAYEDIAEVCLGIQNELSDQNRNRLHAALNRLRLNLGLPPSTSPPLDPSPSSLLSRN